MTVLFVTAGVLVKRTWHIKPAPDDRRDQDGFSAGSQ